MGGDLCRLFQGSGIEIVDCVASSESGYGLSAGIVTVRDSVFSNSFSGMELFGGVAERVRVHSNLIGVTTLADSILDGVTVSDNASGGVTSRSGPAQIRRALIVNNGSAGVSIQGDSGGSEYFYTLDAAIAESSIAYNGPSIAGGAAGVETRNSDAYGLVRLHLSHTLLAGNVGPGAGLLQLGNVNVLDANTVVHNGIAGFAGNGQTRGNNAMLQATPVSGVLTPIPAF